MLPWPKASFSINIPVAVVQVLNITNVWVSLIVHIWNRAHFHDNVIKNLWHTLGVTERNYDDTLGKALSIYSSSVYLRWHQPLQQAQQRKTPWTTMQSEPGWESTAPLVWYNWIKNTASYLWISKSNFLYFWTQKSAPKFSIGISDLTTFLRIETWLASCFFVPDVAGPQTAISRLWSRYSRGVGLCARGYGSWRACLNNIRGGHHHIKLTCGRGRNRKMDVGKKQESRRTRDKQYDQWH